jgi:hypothetical protein
MRFRRLEVQAYRAIDQAEVEFGPGLNVLYGPNDLGKSTLAAAMRAVLLLPAESTAHQAFLPWHDAGPPKVRLTFEREGSVFRVTKVFGLGSLGTAHLESSPDGRSFHEEERGRAVDRRLRELLRWGIEAPGGKGGARGLPESFLSHVLLGDQGDVPMILERSLASDRDGSGKERLHQALQALSQDPVFKRVLEAAQARVDAAFTPTGRRKTGQSSPFAPIKEQITLLGQEFERLTQQRRESEEVQQRIATLDEERLAIEAEIGTLEVCVDRDTELAERLAARRRAAERVAQATRALSAQEALRAELATLDADLVALRASAEAQGKGVTIAEAARLEAESRAAAAERVLVEQSSDVARKRHASARATLVGECSQRQAERAALERLLELRRDAETAEAAHAAELTQAQAAEAAEAASRQKLAAVASELAELGQLTGVLEWRAAELAAERARAALAEAEALDEQARVWRERVRAGLADARALPEVSNPTLAELRQLEQQIEVAAARLEVGLGIVLSVPAGQEVRLEIDGGAERRLLAGGAAIDERAKSRITAHLAGGIELTATAGDPALRGELERLERRWGSEAAPLLQACGVTGLDDLAEFIEAARVRQRELAEHTRQAESAEARALEKRELGADLELHERRAEQRRQALADADLAALQRRLEALAAASLPVPGRAVQERAGASVRLETLLERRRAEAEARRAHLEAELPALSAGRVRSVTRATTLEETRDAARARLAEAWAAQDAGEALPASAELKRRLGDAEKAGAAAEALLLAHDREVAGQLTSVQREREQAARALTDARARYDVARAAAAEVRERLLTLDAQLAERRLRVEPAADSAARLELAQARAELASYVGVEEVTPERLASGQEALVRARGELERVLSELRRAEGALGHVGGDVVAMRERQTEEALERAREQELEQEREYDAYRLLVEQLREVENEQGAHLGRALEAPVSERFERLTEGRYRQVGLDAGLGLQGVAVAGKPRAYLELSEGTQEQLATILRLCIAEYLDTALVLDDHLAQTHRQRAEWFRTTLRESAGRIQIIVLTARPEDYLGPEELCRSAASQDVAGAPVRAIDLERLIRRAHYGAAVGK